MSRLPRPYIPISVRLKVAARQYASRETLFPKSQAAILSAIYCVGTDSQKLKSLLTILFNDGDDPIVHLDHNPALENREKVFRNGVHVDYDPPANDPDHLVYRLAPDHRTKTNVRGEHGQHPDRVLIVKNRRLEERDAGKPPRRVAKIRSRGFQKGPKRKWPSRPFR